MPLFDVYALLKRLDYYQGPIELHITVVLDNTESERERFNSACKAQNGKSIWIELEDGQTKNQPMYGIRFARSTPRQQTDRISQLVTAFAADFSIIRVKVEAHPNNDNIPQSDSATANEPADCYFEHHLALELSPTADLEKLKGDLAAYDGYLSRNRFKTLNKNGLEVRFVTQRYHRLGRPNAEAKLNRLIEYLKSINLAIVDIEQEYNVFDSNLPLDTGWMI